MSRVLRRTDFRQLTIHVRLSPSQHFKRWNSTYHDIEIGSSNSKLSMAEHHEELITDLLKLAKDSIIEPVQREMSFRPRYKRVTVDESALSDIDAINSTDNFLTANDFFMSKVLPVNWAQNGIDYLHDFMPYWSAILVVPFLTKFLFTIPVAILAQRKQDKILPFLPVAMKDYRKAANKYRADRDKFNILTDKIRAKYGFNPLYAQFRPLMVGIAQVPVHMTLYIAIRTMYSAFPDWKYGGLGWFANLSIADPYWVLPVSVGSCMCLSFLNSMRFQKDNQMMLGGGAMSPGMLRIGFGVMSVIMIPIAHFWSAGFNLYMSANILSYMLQLTLMQNNQFRAIWGIKSTQFQFQCQKELREINQSEQGKMKGDMQHEAQFAQIQSKHQRKHVRVKNK